VSSVTGVAVRDPDPLVQALGQPDRRYLGASDYFSALHKSSIDGERRVGYAGPSCGTLRAEVLEAA